MSFIELLTKKIRSPFLIAILILLLSITTIIVASHKLYDYTVSLLTNNLRERILSISITTASHIDSHDIENLQTKEDWKTQEWVRVVNTLHRSKYNNKDIVFMYIFRKSKNDPTKMEFVADADSINPYASIDVNRDGRIEPEGPDKLQWPGQLYLEASSIPEAFEAYKGPLTTSNLYTDQYGTVITAYAPIKDSEGNIVAILATDINADDFLILTSQALKPFLIFITSLTLIMSILILVITHVWKNYSKSLEKINSDRAEFVSIANHHIGTPLTVLKGYISMISENGVEPRAITIIEQSMEKLINIIHDFAEAYSIDDEKIQYRFHNTDINTLIKDIIFNFKPLFSKNKIVFKETLLNTSLILDLDKEKFIRAIHAIFNNSIKYIVNGSILLQISTYNRKIAIAISDTGGRNAPEVPESLLSKFSESKSQFEASVISKDLALYTTKKIIEAHKGHFQIKRNNDSIKVFETIFLITLPLK